MRTVCARAGRRGVTLTAAKPETDIGSSLNESSFVRALCLVIERTCPWFDAGKDGVTESDGRPVLLVMITVQ
jgi:hypothetical protein